MRRDRIERLVGDALLVVQNESELIEDMSLFVLFNKRCQ